MKLLNYTVRSYIIYSIILLLISVPTFYFAIDYIIKRTVDENLINQKNGILANLALIKNEEELYAWEKMDKDIDITPAKYPVKDSLFTSPFSEPGEELADARYLVTTVRIINKDYQLTIRTSLVESKDLLESIILVQAVLLTLLLLGLIIINRSISKRMWRPFNDTLTQLKNFDLGKQKSLQLERNRITEFNSLNETVNHITRKNVDIYQSQREFTENASHEMQTPLAIFQAKLELLMQTSPLSAEQAGFMEELANASQRMNRLNKSLLLLTKIENNQFIDTEIVSIKNMAEKFVEQYKSQADKRNITIQTKYAEDISVDANKSLIEILLSNLLSNAIRHNIKNGSINIICEKQRMIIENTAQGKSLETNKLFQRFQKQSPDDSSIGLGLEIVKKITDLYHFTVTYRFTGNYHSFTIHF